MVNWPVEIFRIMGLSGLLMLHFGFDFIKFLFD